MEGMNKDILLQLASLVLPSDMLLYFDIQKIDEDVTMVGNELIPTVHIHLKEVDNREHMKEAIDLKPNGFTEPTTIADLMCTPDLNHEEEDMLYEHINAILRPVQDMVREELIVSVTDNVKVSYDNL